MDTTNQVWHWQGRFSPFQTRCFHPQTASWRFSKLTKIDLPKKIHKKLAVAIAVRLGNDILGLFIYNDMRSTTKSASQAHKTFPWKFEYIYIYISRLINFLVFLHLKKKIPWLPEEWAFDYLSPSGMKSWKLRNRPCPITQTLGFQFFTGLIFYIVIFNFD